MFAKARIKPWKLDRLFERLAQHHLCSFSNSMGIINSTEFVDANGRRYTDWIPAIRLE